ILSEISHTFITLHVGIGTFLPVRSENLAEHRMLAESFLISAQAANKINNAQRIVAVGTTTVRVLESARWKNGRLLAQEGSTNLFVYPPYRFQTSRSASYEFSSAAIDFAYARKCICRSRVFASGLPGGNSRTLPLLQLRRLHADFVRCSGRRVACGAVNCAADTAASTENLCYSSRRMNDVDQPKGELVIQTIAMPNDTNPNGDIFGGWLTSQMDLGSGILAAKVAQARVVTVAREGMSFLEPVRVGDTVAC